MRSCHRNQNGGAVPLTDRLHAPLQQAEGAVGKCHNVGRRHREAVVRLEVDRSLGNIGGKVSDPLDIGGHADRRDTFPEIDRQGLAPGDEIDGLRLDLALQSINFGAARDNWRGAVRALDKGRRRGANLIGRELAHGSDQAFQLIEIGVEGRDCMARQHSRSCTQPNRSGVRTAPRAACFNVRE